MDKRLIKLSKFLSLVLRHHPEKIGIDLDQNGWARIDELLACAQKAGMPLHLEALREVVEQNDKKRFAISDDGRCIRASQGHSIRVDLGLEPLQPPEHLYHGTTVKFLHSIKLHGLQRGQRHHVHLSPDRETALKVAERRGQPIVLTILAARMHQSGYAFFLSTNGVWLVNEVPVEFLLLP
jgi:putative RNA 2'-phosphotransferase